MADVLLPGIAATRVATRRLTQSVLHPDGVDPAGPGEAVLFVHGNVSSALFWQQTMLAVAETGRHRVLAVDLRGYGDTDPLPIDATRGVADWADDLAALVDALGLDRVHLVGWSMGAGVVLQYLLDAPRAGRLGGAGRAGRRRTASAGRPVPTAPACTPTAPARRRGREPGASSPRSPPATPPPTPRSARGRSCGRSTSRPARCRWTPGSRTSFVASMNSTRTGEDHYPGDSVAGEAWPGVRAGPPRRAQHDGADGVRRLRHRRPAPEAARSCGSAATPTRSSPTPRCSTSRSSARSAPSRAGRAPSAFPPQPMVTADPLGARPLRRHRRRLPRGRAARRRPLTARGAAAGVRRRAARAPRRPRRGPGQPHLMSRPAALRSGPVGPRLQWGLSWRGSVRR